MYGCSSGLTVAQAIDVGRGRAPRSSGADNKSTAFFLCVGIGIIGIAHLHLLSLSRSGLTSIYSCCCLV